MHSALSDLGPLPPAPPGNFLNLDAPEHTRYRTLLTGAFTVRRMRRLTERMAGICGEYLDAMERAGGPADLMTAFAAPVPATMICELLGVPAADRDRFRQLIAGLVTAFNDPGAPVDQGFAAVEETQEYMRDLVAAARAEPSDDLLGDLAATDLSGSELTGVAVLLLIGGFETTANMLGLGTFTLLRHPGQLAALRGEPRLADRVVEELMRYLAVVHTTTRSALAEVELAGEVIAAGETVALSLHAANRDPGVFPDPDNFDPHRNSAGHLGFGHGIHHCLGRQLARMEMRIALPALVSRFPGLRLAVPADDIVLRPDRLGLRGVRQLPVTW
ncbi:cytochrome P450 [Nocardia carnea]|uniref:cytochrome P450 n=1 Tax=Nocardia carnea TaxID=37328 RepID=UPI002457E8C0|nr:cytochrome P450 [Nocardia carnea]